MPSITLDDRRDTPRICVNGAFVFDVNREFRSAYSRLTEGRPVEIDLSRADYIDSAGLGMLVRLREHAGNRNDSVTIIGANPTVRTILDVANFGRLFAIT